MNKIAILFIMSYVLSDCDDSIHPLDYTYAEQYKRWKNHHSNASPIPCNPLGVRTQDPFIKSEVLYLLS